MMQAYDDVVLATDELVGYWRLGEASGDTAFDALGAHHGRYVGVSLGVAGAIPDDTAADFDGRTSAVLIGDSPAFSFAGHSSFTVEAWVRLPEPRENVRVISRRRDGLAGTDGYELVITPKGGISFNRHAGSQVDHLGTRTVLTFGEWSYLVATCGDALLKVYVNGALVGQSAAAASLADVPISLDFGRRSGLNGSASFKGSLDEVAITRRALSADEVEGRYAASGRSKQRARRGPATASINVTPAMLASRERAVALWPEVAYESVTSVGRRSGVTAASSDLLMMPVVAAVSWPCRQWLADLSAQAALAATDSRWQRDDLVMDDLYFWSRFVRLALSSGQREHVPDSLPQTLLGAIEVHWQRKSPSVAEDLTGLAGDPTWPALFAASAELLASDLADSRSETLTAICTTGVRYFAGFGRWRAPGQWIHELPVGGGAAVAPRDGVAGPLLPIVLESLERAFGPEDPGRSFFANVRLGLAGSWAAQIERSHDGETPPEAVARGILLGAAACLPGRAFADIYSDLVARLERGEGVATSRLAQAARGAFPKGVEGSAHELLIRVAADPLVQHVAGSR